MTTKNDITGDLIQTRSISQSYRDNFDRIFRNKNDANEKKKDVEERSEPVEIEPTQE